MSVALIAAQDAQAQIGELLVEHSVEVLPYATPEELAADPPAVDPSLIVLWLGDADASPLKLLDSLHGQLGRLPTILVCEDIPRWQMRAVLNGGVGGVILREEMATTLGPCLRAVLAGQICVPSRHGRQIAPPALSTREKQILGLVVMGYMNGQIAEQLYLAESTVKSHLSSAFTKLGVRSRNEAVELILDADHGLGMGILALGGEPLKPAAADGSSADSKPAPAPAHT